MTSTQPSPPPRRSKRLARLVSVVLAIAALAAVLAAATDGVLQRQERAARDRALHDAAASIPAGRLVDLFATHH